jgi:iron complex transport system substrate-binding protein
MRALLCASLLFCCATGAQAAATVTDQNGRMVKIPDRVERVATLVIPAASMSIAVDHGPARLVGIHPSARQEIADGFLGRIFPAAKRIRADMAGENFIPNVEAILATKPDLVIQWGDRGSAIVDPIARVGLPVLTLRYGDTKLAAEWLQLLGTGFTGRDARGKALADQFLRVHEEIAKASASIPANRKPRVVYLHRTQGNAFQVAGYNTSMDSDIRLAGGVNVAGDLPGFSSVGVEQLLAWAPDVVLLNSFEKDARPAALFGNSLLAGLPAVKNKRVYVYPRGGFRWDPPSQESPLAWRWLQALFHPDMRVPPLRTEMIATYLELYGHELTQSDLDAILRMADNADSLHYREKFAHKEVR